MGDIRIVESFIKDINQITLFRMNDLDYLYTLEKKNYQVNTIFSNSFYRDENLFDTYIEKIRLLTSNKISNGVILSEDDKYDIKFKYDDLIITCNIQKETNKWDIVVYRTRINVVTEKIEKTYYHLGEQGNPYLLLMILLNPDCFNIENFRYSLKECDENELHLYFNKKDAIAKFQNIWKNKIKDIERMEFSALDTYGMLVNKDGHKIALLKNEYETDDIKLDFNIPYILVLFRIYMSLKNENYSSEEIMNIFESLGFVLYRNSCKYDVTVFERVSKYIGFTNLVNVTNDCLTIANSKNFSIQITNHHFDEKINKSYFGLKTFIKDAGGRIYSIDNINFIKNLDENNEYFTYTEIFNLLCRINDFHADDFIYTVFSNKDSKPICYRYLNFEDALYTKHGFMNLSKDNDYVIFNKQEQEGKSWKLDSSNKKYDYVGVDRNEYITRLYCEYLKASLPKENH